MAQAGDDTAISGRGMRFGMFAKRRSVDGSVAHTGKLALPVRISNIVDRHHAGLRFRYGEIAINLSQSHNRFKIGSRSPALNFAYRVPLSGSRSDLGWSSQSKSLRLASYPLKGCCDASVIPGRQSNLTIILLYPQPCADPAPRSGSDPIGSATQRFPFARSSPAAHG